MLVVRKAVVRGLALAVATIGLVGATPAWAMAAEASGYHQACRYIGATYWYCVWYEDDANGWVTDGGFFVTHTRNLQ